MQPSIQTSTPPSARYSVTLSPGLNQALEQVAATLEVPKAEVFRRALTLLKHAVEADKVELTSKNEKQTVLLK